MLLSNLNPGQYFVLAINNPSVMFKVNYIDISNNEVSVTQVLSRDEEWRAFEGGTMTMPCQTNVNKAEVKVEYDWD